MMTENPSDNAAMPETSLPVAQRGRFTLITALAAVVFLVGALVAWGLSSPVGSSPDDDFHLASIWCGSGPRAGVCTPGSSEASRAIPRDLAQSICFAFLPNQAANCQGTEFGTHSDMLDTARGNFSGLYPPGFYWVLSSMVGQTVEPSVLTMRGFNAGLAGLFCAALVIAARSSRRQRVLWTLLAGAVPLAMFIIPSTNPSSWAVIGVAAATLALLEFVGTNIRWKRWANAGIAVGAGLLASSARGDAGVFVAIAAATVLLGAVPTWRVRPALTILPIALGIASLLAFLLSGQSSVAGNGLSDDSALSTASGLSKLQLLIANIAQLPSLIAGVYGTWNLGWLDTPLPGAVSVCAIIAFAAIAFSALGEVRGWQLASVILATTALVGFPLYVLLKTHAIVGSSVQPRYLLPLLLIVLAVLLSGRVLHFSIPQIVVIVAALSLANSLALYANLKRYVVGADAAGFNLNSGAAWWWDSGPDPMTVWFLGSVAFAVASLSAGLLLLPSQRRSRTSRGLQQVPQDIAETVAD